MCVAIELLQSPFTAAYSCLSLIVNVWILAPLNFSVNLKNAIIHNTVPVGHAAQTLVTSPRDLAARRCGQEERKAAFELLTARPPGRLRLARAHVEEIPCLGVPRVQSLCDSTVRNNASLLDSQRWVNSHTTQKEKTIWPNSET